MTRSCIRECGRSAVARGLCGTHYQAALRTGEIKARERDPAVRFWARVDRSESCWNWLGAKDDKGYGRVGWNGKVLLAHRVAFELSAGSIPGGLPLDHLCRNTSCVRPDHLEAVPTRINTARGQHVSATALRTNHCVHGHEYTEENTYLWRGERQCRSCARTRPRGPYKPRANPTKVRTAEATCDVCEQPFTYEKVRRARTVCSDECRHTRNLRIKSASKQRKRSAPG